MITAYEKRQLFTVALIVFVIGMASGSALAPKLEPVATQTATAAYAGALPCTYMIYIISGTTYAQACKGSTILMKSTNAAAVISAAISKLSSGGRLYIMAGTYTITQQINILVNNVTVEGDGAGSILKAASTITGSYGALAILYLYEVNNVVVKDLSIDGSRASIPYACTTPECVGIEADLSNYITFQNLYVHDLKTSCLVFEGTLHSEMVNDFAVNCDADSILLLSYSDTQPARWDTIQDNQIVTASDVGISLNAADTLVEGNVITNITLNQSPYHLNGHDGIYVGDNGNSTEVTVEGNQIYNATDYAISTDADYPSLVSKAIIITGNEIVSCGGAIATQYTKGVDIANNVVQSTTYTNKPAIDIRVGTVDALVSTNNLNDTTSAAILAGANAVLITGNDVFETNNHKPESDAIGSYANNVTISNNVLDFTATTQSEEALYIDSKTYGDQVIGNVILGNVASLQGTGIRWGGTNTVISGNKVTGFSTCIGPEGTPVSGNVVNNVLSKSECATSIQIADNSTIVAENIGFNPIGDIADFLYVGGSGAGDGNFISPIGTTFNLVASTTYTITTTPCTIIILKKGSGSTISIDGQPAFANANGLAFYLPPGHTIDFGPFITAPLIEVIFS